MGGYGMLCVMRVLDEFEPKEATNLVSIPKCVKWILDEFPNVTFKKLKEIKVQLQDLFAKGYIKPNKSPYGAPVFFVHKKDKTLNMCVNYRASTRQ